MNMNEAELTLVVFISACLGGLIGYVFRYLQTEEDTPGSDTKSLEERMSENEIIAGIREPTEYD